MLCAAAMMRRALLTTGSRLSAFWHRVMAVVVDEGIEWQKRRPGILWAILVITVAVVWMAIGFTISGIVGRVIGRRDRRLG